MKFETKFISVISEANRYLFWKKVKNIGCWVNKFYKFQEV